MSQRYHRGFTAAEKTELWDRWQRGESLKAIGRAFGKPSSSIYFQVAPHGAFALRHPEDEFYHVSHETIYRSLFVQARSVLKKERLNHLRSKRTIRRSKRADPNGDRRGQIKDIVSISARPAAASVSSWPPLRRRARPDAHFILSVVA